MECVKCKAEIENDSWYCDQCGIEIKKCKVCGHLGKGKFCTQCRNEMVAAKELIGAPTPEQQAVPASEAEEIEATIRPGGNIQPPSQPKIQQLFLVNKNLNMRLEATNGSVLGRRQGPYTNQLSQYGQISGTHARLDYNPSTGWSVIDLNSSNGTLYNRNRIAANQPQKLSHGSFLQIANIEFFIEIT